RLATHALVGGRTLRRRGRRRSLLRQVPFPGRIRLRPWLGGRLRARRRQLLSQAPGRSPVHTGERPPPAGTSRPAIGYDPRGFGGRPRRSVPPLAGLLGSRDIPDRAGMGATRLAWLSQAHASPVPLGERGLRYVR